MLGGFASGLYAATSAGASPRAGLSASILNLLPVQSAEAGQEPKPNDGDSVTVLVMGLDKRPVDDVGDPTRTDSLMVVRISAKQQTISTLSVPRDLWLPIPLNPAEPVLERVNAAYMYGMYYGYPGGGPALTKATLAYNLGIRIDYYVVVDFETFQRFIDEIGGVDVTLATALNDPVFPTGNYGAITINIPAGPQHLDGERALWFARSRYQSSDFSRMERQQQLGLAIRERLLRFDQLPRLPHLWAEFSGVVQTDVPLGAAVRWAQAAWSIPRERITTQELDQEYVIRARVNGDPFALLPNRERIKVLVGTLFPE